MQRVLLLGLVSLLTAVTPVCLWIAGFFRAKKEVRDRNCKPFPFAPAEIDYVILTHSHIDHSGLLPRLVKKVFKVKSSPPDLALI